MARSGGSLQRVRDALAEKGLASTVRTFPSSTRTAADAARSVGCEVAQIAKSLVFRTRESGMPLLVVASGANRVDLAKVSVIAGEPLEMADPAFVRERTGFAIGGVPPMGHDEKLATLLDRDLFAFELIWAAAGTPDAVFPLSPDQLLEFTGGVIVDVK
jgi:prolyl-tRNA editing enzyme YbaK/EbsC (Cys-tRNA(Pro) deacylase)